MADEAIYKRLGDLETGLAVLDTQVASVLEETKGCREDIRGLREHCQTCMPQVVTHTSEIANLHERDNNLEAMILRKFDDAREIVDGVNARVDTVNKDFAERSDKVDTRIDRLNTYILTTLGMSIVAMLGMIVTLLLELTKHHP